MTMSFAPAAAMLCLCPALSLAGQIGVGVFQVSTTETGKASILVNTGVLALGANGGPAGSATAIATVRNLKSFQWSASGTGSGAAVMYLRTSEDQYYLGMGDSGLNTYTFRSPYTGTLAIELRYKALRADEGNPVMEVSDLRTAD